ncbi:MAG: S9 family peptidase [Gammaproteobacteria bacterium]|nr:S9 family peptidase [Gammaproteobacteria bacterium]
MKAPIAKKISHIVTMHGDSRNDPYAWLRDPNWQQVMRDPSLLRGDIRDYLEQENAFTKDWMQDTEQLQDSLFEEMKARIKEDDSSVPSKDGIYHYYYRYTVGAEHSLYCRYKTPGKEEIILDADTLSKKYDYFDIGECEHSPNHRFLAYCIDIKGSEFYTLYILDLETGKYLKETIENIQGDFVWAMDSETLFYTTLDSNHRPDKVFRHTINTSTQQDKLVYEEKDPGFFVGLDRTESNRFILISAHDHTTSETHYLDAYKPKQACKLFQERFSNIEYSITDHSDTWYITTNADNCIDYKIMCSPLNKTQREHWQDYYLPAEGTLLKDIYMFKEYLVRYERRQGLPKIIVAPLDSNSGEYAIEFDEEAYELGIDPGLEFDTTTVRFSYTSMTTPSQIYDFDMQHRTRELRKQQEVPSGHNPKDYVTKRIFACAQDGTNIPISLLVKKDTPIDGSAPLVLYGYGSYGSSMPASFSTTRLSLVSRGYVYAIAHIRGGMELGYSWYTDGKLKNKKNTFTDFIAAGQYLAESKYTSKGNITVHGGSAGGMLIGAAINLQPDLFHSAIADVPFVDVLNTMCDDTLPLTPPEWPEWGNPITQADDYNYIKSYSPYDNVQAQQYPHLLITAGLTDPRVTYWEPAKWIAKLREHKSDNNVVLLKTNMDAGHAGASGRFDSLKEVALMYAFVLKLRK